SLHGVVRRIGVAGKLGICSSRNALHAGNCFQSLDRASNDLRCAVLAIPGTAGIEREGDKMIDLEPNLFLAEIVQRSNEKSRAAQQHDTKGDLYPHGDLAESLRVF